VSEAGQYRPSHVHRDGYGFENGERVPVVMPEAWATAEPDDRGSALAALDAIRRALVVVIEGGHRDGALVRAAALGCEAGLYASPTEAAKAINVAVSTMIRAIAKLKSEVLRNEPPICGDTIPKNERQIE
jgi:hypothetical protein